VHIRIAYRFKRLAELLSVFAPLLKGTRSGGIRSPIAQEILDPYLQAQSDAAQGMDASPARFARALRQQFAPRYKLLLMPFMQGKHRRLRFGGMKSEIQQILTSA
jgi:hypothetical protein